MFYYLDMRVLCFLFTLTWGFFVFYLPRHEGSLCFIYLDMRVLRVFLLP